VGTIFRIERFAIHDGPGIRTTVFLKGCPLRCAWCHSPESQSPDPEFMPLADRCIACGACASACPEHAIGGPLAAPTTGERNAADRARAAAVAPQAERCWLSAKPNVPFCSTRCVDACPTGARVIVGQDMSVASVMNAIERDRVFYDESGGGVTLSGGEPLMQPGFVTALVKACRERRIHVAIDTSGFGDPDVIERLQPDLFLFDVKAVDENRHREITGVSNKVILENLARVAARRERSDGPNVRQSGGRTIVRFPLVPGVTDTDDNVRDIGRVVSSLGLARLDVLPYHRAGIAKYQRLGRPYALADTEPPSVERIAAVVDILSEHGLSVRVGG
jgi:pyruvate formate lyase activating enzyme